MQSLLSTKEKLEEIKKLEFGKSMEVYQRAEQQLQSYIKKEEDCIHVQQELLMKKRINPVHLKNINLFILHNKKKIETSIQQVKAAQEDMEEKRKGMLEFMQQRKMMERLKEKALLDFIIEENKQEQINIDELLSFRYKPAQGN